MFASRVHGGGGGWANYCNAVCTFVNVHDNTVDDTSVVVDCSADRSTLTYYRAQEQTPVQTGHTSQQDAVKLIPDLSELLLNVTQTDLGSFICLLKALLRCFFVRKSNVLVTRVSVHRCSDCIIHCQKQKQGSFVQFVLDEMIKVISPGISFFTWVKIEDLFSLLAETHMMLKCFICVHLSLSMLFVPFSDLDERDSTCSLVDGCSTLIRYKK